MDLFTIIMDLDGGTYIYQVRANDEWDALLNWPAQLKVKEIKGLGEKMRARIIRELEQHPEIAKPTLIDGCANVWATVLSVWGSSMFLNIVKTAED